MPTDKSEPSNSASSLPPGRVGEKHSEGAARSRFAEAPEHHYEPEAHHDWFPSERFFVSWMVVGLLGFFCMSVALTAHHLLNPKFRAGDLAEHEIRATRELAVEDEKATNAVKERAKAGVVPVFKANAPVPLEAVASKVDEIGSLQKLGLIQMPELTVAEHIALLKAADAEFDLVFSPGRVELPAELAKIRSKLEKNASGKALAKSKLGDSLARQRLALQAFRERHSELADCEETIAVTLSASDLPGYSETLKNAATRLYRVISKVPVDDAELLNDTAIEFMPDAWNTSLRKASAALVSSVMVGSCSIDRAATDAKSQEAADRVKPVLKQVHVGDLIVPRGKEVSPEAVRILNAMGITNTNRLLLVGGLLVSLAAAVVLVGLFLYTFEAKLLFSTRSLGLMYTVCVITILLGVVLGKNYPQIVPLPAAALLLSIFFGPRAATAVTLPLAIFLAVDHLIDFNNLIALTTAAGAAIATYSKRRHALMSTGMAIGILQSFGFLAALAMTQAPMTATALGSMMGMEFLGGIASSIVAIGILPFLENIFGLITPFRLAELTDADQPLLRRLEENAPGTYQHSLAVANLAESGARAIGADVNLVRAGAYYHDVGKMVRPKFFIENQLGAANPHESMTPEQSRERVLAHVTDGLELARQYTLPKAVQDFIPMHQGTSLMAFFYHKACLRYGVDNVDAHFYRYPGPKPQSKETSIVMLADVSEAVTHSMKDPSQEEVEEAISKVFQNRWDDGQFTESGLSYSELQRVMKAFVRVWRTLHHERLKYPATTTGRMPVPPAHLPTKASIENAVMGNEFPTALPLHDESGTMSTGGTDSTAGGDADRNVAPPTVASVEGDGASGDQAVCASEEAHRHEAEERGTFGDCC